MEKTKWFDKTWLVVLLLIVFFPLGAYALCKSGRVPKAIKIACLIVFGLIFLVAIAPLPPPPPNPETKDTIAPLLQNDSISSDTVKSIKKDTLVKKKKSYNAPATYAPTTEYYNGHVVHTGKRGGRYYINSHGNKTYL